MKKTAWIGVVPLLMFLARPLAGQPVISSSQLPSNGDTFFMAVDKLPAGIRVLAPGPNQRWDFTSSDGAFLQAIRLEVGIQRQTRSPIPDHTDRIPFGSALSPHQLGN
ncbi:MAG: hypothetical protein IPH16_15015 [Haliscomenobacter sp.]|nr:hypothetical protein [Haliscomenobacter sp.]